MASRKSMVGKRNGPSAQEKIHPTHIKVALTFERDTNLEGTNYLTSNKTPGDIH